MSDKLSLQFIYLLSSCTAQKCRHNIRHQRASAAISSINDARCARWGCRLQPGYGLGTLAHFLNNDRNLERCADGGAIIACGITDFVAARLCGALLTDTTMAASWGGFDVASKTWDASAMIDYGIPNDVLPDIVPPGSPLNPLTPEYARRWGLAETVQVCAGLGDNQASILAGGTLKHGTCVVNIGTGGQVSIVRRGYDYRRGLETRPLIGDYYAYVGSSLCGGWAYAYVAEFLSAAARSMTNTELSRDEVLECMNRMGQDAPSHADGLVVEPSFLGSRESGRRYGSIRHIDAQNFTPGNLIRATANGIVDELYEHHQSVGLPVTELRAAGNAVRKVAFVQHAIADRWGMRPTLTAQREEAARGAALLAASELGLVAHGSLFDNDET